MSLGIRQFFRDVFANLGDASEREMPFEVDGRSLVWTFEKVSGLRTQARHWLAHKLMHRTLVAIQRDQYYTPAINLINERFATLFSSDPEEDDEITLTLEECFEIYDLNPNEEWASNLHELLHQAIELVAINEFLGEIENPDLLSDQRINLLQACISKMLFDSESLEKFRAEARAYALGQESSSEAMVFALRRHEQELERGMDRTATVCKAFYDTCLPKGFVITAVKDLNDELEQDPSAAVECTVTYVNFER